MRSFIRILLLLATLAPACYHAQNKEAQQLVDEQLASKLFQKQDFEQAKEIYLQLFNKKGQTHHFNQYVECLLRLGDYDTAEKTLNSFLRKNPSYWKAKVDLLYAYRCDGKKKKAEQQFDDILNKLPDNQNSVNNITNMLRSRMLNDEALAVLDKAATTNADGYPYYLEKATVYHSMLNFEEAFKYYFLELEARPDQYASIKNKLQSLLLYDVNKSVSDQLRMALLKKNQEQPDNTEIARLLVWLSLQEEDYDIALAQCKSLDRKFNDQDAQIDNIAHICLDNGQYDLAKDAFDYLLKKGKINPFYGDALIGSIKTENLRCKADNVTDRHVFERLSKKIDNAYPDVGSKEYPDLVEIHADLLAYHLGQPQQAVNLLQEAIETTGNKIQQCRLKLKLADVYLYTDEVWEATLLYSQIDKAMKEEPLGHEARFRNAQLRYFIGEFAWAQTQLNVLKAATSKLIANDAMSLSLIIGDNLEADASGQELARLAQADYKIYQHKEEQALPILDSVCANGNDISKPHALYRIAEIKERNRDYVLADTLYLQIVAEFPDSYMADDALMRAALLEHQQLKNKEAAKKHYEQLIDQYPTSLYTAQAKKNFRKLGVRSEE